MELQHFRPTISEKDNLLKYDRTEDNFCMLQCRASSLAHGLVFNDETKFKFGGFCQIDTASIKHEASVLCPVRIIFSD